MFDIGEHVGGEIRPARSVKDALTLDEVGRLIDAAKDEAPDVRAMIVVQVATGMRFCEVSALEWRDSDLENASLRLERSQVEGVAGAPKTESTRRRVYLPDTVVEVLRSQKVAQHIAGRVPVEGEHVPHVVHAHEAAQAMLRDRRHRQKPLVARRTICCDARTVTPSSAR